MPPPCRYGGSRAPARPRPARRTPLPRGSRCPCRELVSRRRWLQRYACILPSAWPAAAVSCYRWQRRKGLTREERLVQRSAIDKPRLEAIDVARGLALVAMAIYHFAWDLEFFGYVPHAMTAQGGWKLLARCIASSFLFLVGVSLFLGHARGIRWRPFLRRLAMVAGAAAAISLVTWLAVPGGLIFFGILHQF